MDYWIIVKVEEVIKGGTFSVQEEKYAILRTTKIIPDIFAAINDGNEITLVMEQYRAKHSLTNESIEAFDPNWRIITFNMELPFELVGFIATVSKVLAEKNISIFSISSFSTDHILVKDDVIDEAINALKSIGFNQKQ